MDTARARILLALLLLVSCVQPTPGPSDALGADDAGAAAASEAEAEAEADTEAEAEAARRAIVDPSRVFRRFVTGRVVDASGVVIAGARVRHLPDDAILARRGMGVVFDVGDDEGRVFWREDALPETSTDLGGRFTIPLETCDGRGAGVLVLSAPGCETRCVSAGPSASTTCELGDLVLPSGRSIVGRLVDGTGSLLGGVLVELGVDLGGFPPSSASDGMVLFALPDVVRTRSDAAGRFRLDGLPRIDEVTLRVRSLVDDPTLGPFALATRTSRRSPVFDAGDLSLAGRARRAPVTGVVLDADGRPVVGARVLLARASLESALLAKSRAGDASGDTSAAHGAIDLDQLAWQVLVGRPDVVRTLTDGRGAFAFDAVCDAECVLVIDADGWLPARHRIAADASTPQRVELQRPGDLVLQFVEERGTPVDARVLAAYACADASLRPGPSARSAAVVRGEAPGRAVVRGAGRAATCLVVEADGWPRQVVSAPGVDPHRVRETTLALSDGLSVTGRVVDERGAPIAGAQVSCSDSDASGWAVCAGLAGATPVVSDPDGRFVLRVLPGEHEVSATAEGFAQATRSARCAAPGTSGTSGAAVALDDLVLRPTGTLRVTVRDLRGALRAGARLTLGTPMSPFEAYTDGAGVATFLDVSAGPHTVGESSPRASVRCEVRAGETTDVELVTPVHLRLAGQVTRRGKPLRGARVRIAEGVTSPEGEGGHSVDLDGRFETLVHSPSVSVSAVAPDGKRSREVELWIVTDGEEAFADVQLAID